MCLELHVWGPAFGLPSIDAECLATIAYLAYHLEKKDWMLIPASNPNGVPTGELPALKAGSIWIGGYRSIVDFVSQQPVGWDPDRTLTEQQKADCVAFCSFIESRGQPLLDLSLYVSSENYSTATRTALANILDWPHQWLTPPKLRAAAKKRAEHLGLSSLDIDTAHGDLAEANNLTAQIPKSLRKPKETVSSILGKSTHRNQFRLDAITGEFLDPLSELLGDQDGFLGWKPLSSLDFLALGYLALMQAPAIPHDWLKRALREQYPRLDSWTTKMYGSVFGTIDGLPWQRPEKQTISATVTAVCEAVLDSTPVLGQLGRPDQPTRSGQDAAGSERYERKQVAMLTAKHQRERYSQLFAATLGASSVIGYLLWAGMLRMPRWSRPGSALRSFGAAGGILGLAS